eukprot:4670031-Lingulodinium_polyedra.AAC.1
MAPGRQQLHCPQAGQGCSQRGAGSGASAVLRSPLCCLGAVLEREGVWEGASRDAVRDAPVPQGNKRARRMDPALRRAMAEAVGSRQAGRTARQFCTAFRFFRKEVAGRVNAPTVEQGQLERLFLYWQTGREAFSPSKCAVLGMSTDGTRMSKRDTAFMALYSPTLDMA